jgi:RNA polymerase I-specific transcription initiation factor RRN3
MELCPPARTEFVPIISAGVPRRQSTPLAVWWYYRQCLECLSYLPGAQGEVLELMIEQSLGMDVEIKIRDDGEVTVERENDDKGVIVATAEPDAVLPIAAVEDTVDEMAERLDLLMELLFGYLDHQIRQHPANIGTVLYPILLRIFNNSILLTHKSKFVQFLMLFLCGGENRVALLNSSSSSPQSETGYTQDQGDLYRSFAQSLVDVYVDRCRSTVTRQIGACYLASFVSRSKFVCPETVCEAIAALLRWAEAYMDQISHENGLPQCSDARAQCRSHSLFYTVCQAAFYIVCFRGSEAIEHYRHVRDGENHNDSDLSCIDIGSARWNRVCGHALQPLKYCLETVRAEFLQCARVFHLVDTSVIDVVERQQLGSAVKVRRKKIKGSRILTPGLLEKERQNGGVGGLGRGTNPLDSFFPFDPYLLRRSNTYVESYYLHWEGSIEDRTNSHEDGDDAVVNNDGDESLSDDDEERTSISENQARDVTPGFEPNDDSSAETEASETDDDSFSYSRVPDQASTTTPLPVPVDEATRQRQELTALWTQSLKRARAPSMDNEYW